MTQTIHIRKVAVLGAGVMGAQIAAHCINARVPVVLFDLPAKEGSKNGIVTKAVANLKKLSPAPLGDAGEAGLINLSYSNLGRVEVDGVDVQADWGLTFKDVGIGLPGSITENIQFGWLNHFKTTLDQNVLALVDYAGTLGGGQVGTSAGSYRWRLLYTFGYNVGPLRLSLQWQHKPKVEQAAAATSTTNQITGYKAYDLFSISGSVSLIRALNVRFGIDNLFDKAPPFGGVNRAAIVANGQLPGGGYNSSQYDVIGRRFYSGASYKF